MKQVWRILVAVLAIAALAAGGTVAYGQRGGGQAQAKRAAARTFTFDPAPKANPEGIVFDKRRQRFFVSDTGDGKIYSGTLGNTTMTPFIPAQGAAAVGLEIRRNKLYVAGGPSGEIRVYDLRTRKEVAKFDTGSGGFLNDVAVTSSGDVFVTDSFRPTLWHVTPAQVRAGSGKVQPLATPPAAIGFTADPSGQTFNLNGIVARNGHLVVVNTNTGRLFRIDLNRRRDAIRRIARVRGATVPTGDGMILDRGRLVVVQGGNAARNVPTQISFVKFRRGAGRAQVQGTQRSRRLVGPSTITRAGNRYLVVNANFGAPTVKPNVVGLPRGR